jgi:hypothetical protein
MKLPEILAHCEAAFRELAVMRGDLENGMQSDTAFELGKALGSLHKAKALVERDLKHQREQEAADE